jgi:Tfp pilus assembly protein PilF
LFKENNKCGKAFKKISKAVKMDPNDADGWVLWAMMLRSVG